MSRNDETELDELFRMLLLSAAQATSAARDPSSDGIRPNDYQRLSDHVCSMLRGNKERSIANRERIAQQVIDKSPVVEDAKKYVKHNISFKIDKDEVACRSIIINLTDSSPKFARHVAESGYLELLLEELKLPAFNPAYLDPNGDASQRMRHEFVVGSFTVLHNCLWHHEQSKNIVRDSDGLQTILYHLRNEKSERLQMEVLMTLADAADLDKNAKVLEATESNLQFIMKNGLEPALEKEMEGETYSYSVDEVLHCLNSIAKNDSNAKQLVKLGILDILSTILQSKEKLGAEITENSVRLLQQLSFTSAQSLRENKQLLEQVIALKSSDVPAISEASKGALLQLEVPRKRPVSARTTNQVMISYSWVQQKLAIKLKDCLIERGFKVWIDVEKIEGSILEKMAEGVEGSEVIIMLTSEDYKDSENCRSEATYARKLKKHKVYALAEAGYDSRGWLGAMMGDELHYDIASNFTEASENLAKRVKGLLK